jgi:NADP-dependent 3-hydroxy acid dehydrogenase YdfG
MQKDTRTPSEQSDAGIRRNATAGHARQRRYDPHAPRNKAISHSPPKAVLVAAYSDSASSVVAECVRQLAEAGHRVVTIMPDESGVHDLADVIETGRVINLPCKPSDSTRFQSAINALPPAFRSLDAVVNIMPLLPGRITLLGADAPLAEVPRSVHATSFVDTLRAALPSLLASGCGLVVEVTLHAQPDRASNAHADALCAALRYELDDLGIRLTHIRAGPMKADAGANRSDGNRPPSNGVRAGALNPADVAQTVAWTLSQPAHVTVRDIAVCSPPLAQPVLSQREREVLEWTACGKTAEEISRILDLSVRTVNFHVNTLVLKLQCCNKTAAVVRAALLGMLI